VIQEKARETHVNGRNPEKKFRALGNSQERRAFPEKEL
jgi:hypothetical protein